MVFEIWDQGGSPKAPERKGSYDGALGMPQS